MEIEGKLRFLNSKEYETSDSFITKKIKKIDVDLFIDGENNFYIPFVVENNTAISPIYYFTSKNIYKLNKIDLNDSINIKVDNISKKVITLGDKQTTKIKI